MTKRSVQFKIILWAIVAIIALVVFIGLSFGPSRLFHFSSNADQYENYRGGKEVVMDEELSGSIQKINVAWIDRVDIFCNQETNASSARVIVYADENNSNMRQKIDASLKNGELRIDLGKNKWFDFISFHNDYGMALELHLPKKEYDRLSVETISGDMNITGMLCQDVDLTNISGDVLIDGLEADSAGINTISGTIRGEAAAVKALTIETVSGKTKLEGAFGGVQISSISGDIALASQDMLSSWSSDTVSGAVELTLPDNAKFSIASDMISGSLYSEFDETKESGGAVFQFSSVSGKVRILKAEH